MEINGVTNYAHRKTPSSHRFHSLFTLSTTTSSTTDFTGDELTEADLFSDSSESTHSPASHWNNNNNNLGFRRLEKSGILAALPDDCGNRFSVSATPFRTIPKPRVVSELTQSVPCGKFHNQQHSAPVNVPMMKMKKAKKFGQLDENEGNRDDDDEEMLPPHEIVAMKLKSTSSVLEGVGRTLKGRDLRQVRNAVWSQTGFLD